MGFNPDRFGWETAINRLSYGMAYRYPTLFRIMDN
jgi:hypothetical protein